MNSVILAHVPTINKYGKKINSDIIEYFTEFNKRHFDNLDLFVISHDNESLLDDPEFIRGLSDKYSKIILSGKGIVSRLAKTELNLSSELSDIDSPTEIEDPDGLGDVVTELESSQELMRYHGVEIDGVKFDFIYGLTYYINKDAVNTYHFDIMNRLGKNPYQYVPDVEFRYVSMDNFTESYNELFRDSPDLGFDIESRGFPEDQDFRLLGFSLSNDKDSVYYYFDRDDSIYQEQLILNKNTLLELFEDEDRLKVFNCKFENNGTKRIMSVDKYFHDTQVYTKILKTYGTLKFNSNLLLNAPLWKDEVQDFMNNYKELVKWLRDFSYEVTKEVDLSDSGYTYDYIKDCYSSDSKYAKELLGLTDDIKIVFKEEDKSRITLVRTHGIRLLDNPKYFKICLREQRPDLYEFFSNYKDTVETDYDYTRLIEYYHKGYNEWQVVPYGLMGHYCCLDSLYTYKLFDNFYNTNYHGIKDAFRFYNNQASLASILEANGSPIDINYFNYYRDKIDEELTKTTRDLINNHSFRTELIKELTNSNKGRVAKEIFRSEINKLAGKKSLMTKDVQSGVHQLYLSYLDESGTTLKEYLTSYNENLESRVEPELNKLRSSGQKMTKTSIKKVLKRELSNVEYSLHTLIEVLNSKLYIGFKDQSTEVIISELGHYFSKMKVIIDEELDKKIKGYINSLDNFESYNQVENFLNITSPTHKNHVKFCRAILNYEDNKIIMFKYEFFNRFISILQCSNEFLNNLKLRCRDLKVFYSLCNAIVNDLDLYEDYQIDNSARDNLKKLVDKCKRLVEEHLQGKYFTKELILRYILSWTHHSGDKLATIEQLNPGHRVAAYVIKIKQLLKLKSSVVNGKIGGGSFVKSSGIPLILGSGDKSFYKAKYFDNFKYTLRWSSPRHTVSSHSDYNLCYTSVSDDRLFIHMDMASSEARLAFAVSNETGMINAILEGLDIHGYNANNSFNLGYSRDEIYKIKSEKPLHRSWAKIISFAILYGAGASSIAQQINTTIEHAQELLDGYYKGNPNFANFVSQNQINLKKNLGFITLPYFNHLFYIGNPYHYSIKQKGLNYILQNLSSSLCAYLGFELYKDLRDNYGIIINYYAFIHDALEFDVPLSDGDILLVMDRIDYWFRIFPYQEYNIPQGYDYELGVSPYSGTPFNYKYLGKGLFEISTKIEDFGDKCLSNKDEYLRRLNNNLNIIEESVEEVGVGSSIDPDLVIKGVRIYNITTEYRIYKYSAKIDCSNNRKLIEYFESKLGVDNE